MNQQLIPPPGELIKALTVAWLRVGYEALGLLAYTVKQNDEPDVSASEEATNDD